MWTQDAKYTECWPCLPFDILLIKYFSAACWLAYLQVEDPSVWWCRLAGTVPIHWNIKSAPASPGRSRVGPALYVFNLLDMNCTSCWHRTRCTVCTRCTLCSLHWEFSLNSLNWKYSVFTEWSLSGVLFLDVFFVFTKFPVQLVLNVLCTVCSHWTLCLFVQAVLTESPPGQWTVCRGRHWHKNIWNSWDQVLSILLNHICFQSRGVGGGLMKQREGRRGSKDVSITPFQI